MPSAAIGTVTVVGNRTGTHAGSTTPLPDNAGVTFDPSISFAAGETVTVTSKAIVAGDTSYSFTVGTPAPDPGVQLAAGETPTATARGTRAMSAPTFITRPDLRPPGVKINVAAAGTAPGLLFATPVANSTAGVDQGVMIYNNDGEPVWFRHTSAGIVGDAFVGEYLGKTALFWYEGQDPYGPGNYRGEWVVVDTAYQELARIRMGNGYRADVHDIQLTDRGTAYLMAYSPLTCTGIAPLADCRPGGTVLESVLQEVDLATGTVLWEWHSLDHIPLARSVVASDAPVFDYIHTNSLDLDVDGDVLLSARTTSAVYRIDRSTGELVWTFGGNDTDFPNLVNQPSGITGPDYQHDFTHRGGNSYGWFDNGVIRGGPSWGAIATLDPGTGTATYTQQLIHNPVIFGSTQGSMQGLPAGHNLAAWGGLGQITEFDVDGTPVFDASLVSTATYRQFRFEWTGTPAEAPVAKALPSGSGTAVSVSWNGDTRTAKWRILTGSSPDQLSASTTVARTGFETTTVLPGGPSWVAAEALDGSDSVLGRTAPVQGSQWFQESAAPPAGPTDLPLVGDFGGTRNDDALYYRPGSGADVLQVSNGQGGFTPIGLSPVGGTYSPLVGDFVGDDRDEVLWTLPGSANAYMWRFDLQARSGTVTTASASFKVPATVTRALVLDNRPSYGGGYDEVFWYAAGAAPDRVDRFSWPASPGGLSITSRPITVSGTYTLATGDFDGNGQADVLFYSPGPQRDSIWFTQGTAAGSTGSRPSVFYVDSTYTPFAANFTGTEQRDEILYNANGAAGDVLWTFDALGAFVAKDVTTAATGTGYVLSGPNDRLMTWEAGSSPAIWLLAPGPSASRPSGNTPLASGYRPAIGDFTGAGGTSSVLWYDPGAGVELLYRGA